MFSFCYVCRIPSAYGPWHSASDLLRLTNVGQLCNLNWIHKCFLCIFIILAFLFELLRLAVFSLFPFIWHLFFHSHLKYIVIYVGLSCYNMSFLECPMTQTLSDPTLESLCFHFHWHKNNTRCNTLSVDKFVEIL